MRRSVIMLLIFEDPLKIHCLDFIPIVFYKRGIDLLRHDFGDSLAQSCLAFGPSKTCFCYVIILEIP